MARILQYEGISPISRSISFLTWNRTTHTAWEFDDGRVVEAWGGDHVNAVRITKNFAHGHTPGTIVKAYKLPTLSANQKHNIECYLHQQVGKPYNWRGCLRFVTRRDPQSWDPESFDIADYQPEKWFCSCLVYAACLYADVPILTRIPPWRVSPGLVNLSPHLKLAEIRTVPE